MFEQIPKNMRCADENRSIEIRELHSRNNDADQVCFQGQQFNIDLLESILVSREEDLIPILVLVQDIEAEDEQGMRDVIIGDGLVLGQMLPEGEEGIHATGKG